jgi:type II secretory pathway component PulF
LLAYLVIPLVPNLVLGGVEEFLRGLWGRSWEMAAGIAALWMGWRFLIQFRHFRQGFDRVKLSLPWFGGTARRTAVARWARAMAMLLQAGVPIRRSMEAAGAACGNAAIQHSVGRRIAEVLGGTPLSQIMTESRDFPDQAVDMVATGERTGDTPEMLERVAGYYELEAVTASKQTAVSVGVLAFLLVAVLVGYYVISFWTGYYGKIFDSLEF